MNYIEENLKIKAEILGSSIGDNLSEVDFMKLGRFRCIECGEFISPATLRFYDYDVTKVKCYDCQNNNN